MLLLSINIFTKEFEHLGKEQLANKTIQIDCTISIFTKKTKQRRHYKKSNVVVY